MRYAAWPSSTRKREVYGYELLMRTSVRELPDPMVVLRLAAAEGKPCVRRLTWLVGLESIRMLAQNRATPPNAKFFYQLHRQSGADGRG